MNSRHGLARFGAALAQRGCKLPDARIGYRLEAGPARAFSLRECACCGSVEVPSPGTGDEIRSGTGARVPYCPQCLHHQETARTRRLATLLASALSGATFAVAIPLLWPALPASLALSAPLAMAIWPLLIDSWWFAPPKAPHTACEEAVWEGASGLIITRRSVARLLAAQNDAHAKLRAAPVLQRRRPVWLLAGLAVTALISVWTHTFFHPVLRVLNLSGRTLAVFVDDERVLTLVPTRSESPLAGAALRVSAGLHRLQVRSVDGGVLSTQTERLIAGRDHLYAPLNRAHCFWIETTHYGRSGAQTTRQVLPGRTGFWLLPERIDLWLAAAPPAGDRSRLSGGEVSALRQGACEPSAGALVRPQRPALPHE